MDQSQTTLEAALASECDGLRSALTAALQCAHLYAEGWRSERGRAETLGAENQRLLDELQRARQEVQRARRELRSHELPGNGTDQHQQPKGGAA